MRTVDATRIEQIDRDESIRLLASSPAGQSEPGRKRWGVMRSPSTATPTLTELSREECFALLATQVVGRVAVATPGEAPIVIPVNFVLDGDAIVFRSSAGTKLHLLAGNPVSFQVDGVDPNRRRGWSVLAWGKAVEVGSWRSATSCWRPGLAATRDAGCAWSWSG
jgi:hypothetical protein